MMKNKLLLYCLGAFLSMMCCLTACNDDNDLLTNDEKTSGDYWEAMSGMYRGNMIVLVDNYVVDTLVQQVEIKSDNRNKMTLSLSSLVVDEMIWRNVFFKNVYFLQNDSGVKLYAETVQYLGNIPNVKLNLEGHIVGDKMDIKIVANSVSIRPIELSFDGEKIADVLNDEAWIKKMTLNHELVIRNPSYAGMTTAEGESVFVFFVSDTLDMDSTDIFVKPEFELSEGAVISYPDSVMNFAEEVRYTIWAEDMIRKSEVVIICRQATVQQYEIGAWHTDYGWEEPIVDWGTNNGLFNVLKDEGKYTGDNYVVRKVNGLFPGDRAAEMRTVMTGTGEDKEIFAGSFYQGVFDLDMQEPLYGPIYGVPSLTNYRPTTLRGYYKYSPSSEVYSADSLCVDTVALNDTCAISAILYEVNTMDENLDSVNYMNDPRVIAIAEMGDQAGVNQPEFGEFSVDFRYIKNYVKGQSYKLAIICSSSKGGKIKRGAPGSMLTVGGFEVMYAP